MTYLDEKIEDILQVKIGKKSLKKQKKSSKKNPNLYSLFKNSLPIRIPQEQNRVYRLIIPFTCYTPEPTPTPCHLEQFISFFFQILIISLQKKTI